MTTPLRRPQQAHVETAARLSDTTVERARIMVVERSYELDVD